MIFDVVPGAGRSTEFGNDMVDDVRDYEGTGYSTSKWCRIVVVVAVFVVVIVGTHLIHRSILRVPRNTAEARQKYASERRGRCDVLIDRLETITIVVCRLASSWSDIISPTRHDTLDINGVIAVEIIARPHNRTHRIILASPASMYSHHPNPPQRR